MFLKKKRCCALASLVAETTTCVYGKHVRWNKPYVSFGLRIRVMHLYICGYLCSGNLYKVDGTICWLKKIVNANEALSFAWGIIRVMLYQGSTSFFCKDATCKHSLICNDLCLCA